MKAVYPLVLAGLVLAGTAVPASAHHEIGGYDLEHTILVDGVVHEFVWANPHVMLYLDVVNAHAGTQWALEGGAVQALAHNGWTRESLHRGDRIQVLLAPKFNANYAGEILRVLKSDGQVLSAGMPPGTP